MLIKAILLLTSLMAFCIRARKMANHLRNDSNRLNPPADHLLIRNLLQNYNKKLRPSDTVDIKLALNLNYIVDVIQREQILVLNVYLDQEWVDHRLKWNMFQHRNLKYVRMNSELLWR